MILLYAALVLAQPPAAPIDNDVVAQAVLPAPRAQVYAWLLDMGNQEKLLAGCTKRWDHGAVHVGMGAAATVTYDLALMNRRLPAVVSAAEEPRRIDVDHQGPKGFVTRFLLTEQGEATKVDMHSYIGDAPWPLRKYYTTRIQPLWRQCYADGLAALDGALRAGG